MTTTSPPLPWVGFSSTVLEHRPVSPARYQLPQCHRLLPVTLASSRSTFPALLSFSPSSSFLGTLRVHNLLQHAFLGRNYLRSQSRSSASSISPPLPPQPQSRGSKQISGKPLAVSPSSVLRSSPVTESEEVFFDGGVHFGDLVVNLVFGFTLVWLPLTLTAVFRNLFLRYRFTNLRATVQSGVLGGDRKDFSYDVVKDVKVIPRFIGEWGDMAIELKDGTNVEIRCVPKFREIANYIEQRAAGSQKPGTASSSSAREGTRKKGFT